MGRAGDGGEGRGPRPNIGMWDVVHVTKGDSTAFAPWGGNFDFHLERDHVDGGDLDGGITIRDSITQTTLTTFGDAG